MTESTASVGFGSGSTLPTVGVVVGTPAAEPSTTASTSQDQQASQEPVAERTDPELDWLSSGEARRYQGHWVALSPQTGEFLGLADSNEDFRRWQQQHATLVFVEPPGYRTGA
jgi:hypothetical protein